MKRPPIRVAFFSLDVRRLSLSQNIEQSNNRNIETSNNLKVLPSANLKKQTIMQAY